MDRESGMPIASIICKRVRNVLEFSLILSQCNWTIPIITTTAEKAIVTGKRLILLLILLYKLIKSLLMKPDIVMMVTSFLAELILISIVSYRSRAAIKSSALNNYDHKVITEKFAKNKLFEDNYMMLLNGIYNYLTIKSWAMFTILFFKK